VEEEEEEEVVVVVEGEEDNKRTAEDKATEQKNILATFVGVGKNFGALALR
jgi:hypothetical protein